MAKREIPEVNAGSMADVAFLLLIFFIVTTTMNKDTAYLRKIPKEVETHQEQQDIQKKNIFKITINDQNVIKARDTIIQPENIQELSKKIKHFYLVNRDKKTNRVKDFPYYAFGTEALFRTNLDQQKKRLDALENRKKALERKNESTQKIEKLIGQANDAISKWQKKLDMMKLYTKFSGKTEIPIISMQAHIRLEAFNHTDYSAYIAVQSEVQKAITEMRNKTSEELFNEDYTTMQNYVQQNALDVNERVLTYKKRMGLIEELFPLRLIEVKPKR